MRRTAIDSTLVFALMLAAMTVACDKLPATMPWSQSAESDAGSGEGHSPDLHKLNVMRDGVSSLSIKLGELQRKVRGEQPRVHDALENDAVVYEGVHLAALLDTLIGPDWVRADHVRLRSHGGEVTDISPTRLLARKSWLVWKRMDRPDFVVTHNGRALPAGPLYLVWETGIESGVVPGMVDPDTWAYGVVSVDIVTTPAPSAVAFALPADATPGANAGSAHYRKYCAHCHTLGGSGASSGPELLRPVPVTEVWRPGFLERFLDNPTTIRSRATTPKLPADVANRRQVIGDIIAFLHAAAQAPQTVGQPATATATH